MAHSSDGVKVLLADEDVARARAVASALEREPAVEVVRVGPTEILTDVVLRHAPDVVLVDMSRPDRDALEGLRSLSRDQPRPVVLFVDRDDPAFMEEAIAAGVVSYNVGGVPDGDIKPLLRAAVAMFRRHEGTRAALDRAQTRLREREMVDRAKSMLIRERDMTEPEAHRWLQRLAMASGRRLPEVAASLLERGIGR